MAVFANGLTSFNPSQVFYKPDNYQIVQVGHQSFNPSQVFYKHSCLHALLLSSSLFQSLIGILQTFRAITELLQKNQFQSLIGILQTYSYINNHKKHHLVSIPHRYSTNNKNCYKRYRRLESFNPSQVFYKQNTMESIWSKKCWFQSLIGILQTVLTGQKIAQNCVVSIPHRYSTNSPYWAKDSIELCGFNPSQVFYKLIAASSPL